MARDEHKYDVSDTVIIERLSNSGFAEKLANALLNNASKHGHICLQGERLKAIEVTVNNIDRKLTDDKTDRTSEREALYEHIDAVKKELSESINGLYRDRNEQAKDIVFLKTAGWILISSVLVMGGFFAWAWDQIRWLLDVVRSLPKAN